MIKKLFSGVKFRGGFHPLKVDVGTKKKNTCLLFSWVLQHIKKLSKSVRSGWGGFLVSLNRENTKRKVEHSNLPSKEQLSVDYSIGKFLLVYTSLWSKLLQNIKWSECWEHELNVEFSDAIGHSSKIILKCMSCS